VDGSVKSVGSGAAIDLRAFAAGQTCTLMLDGVCAGGTERTVGAHARFAHIAGMGQKPTDLALIHCCTPCHDVLDGRRQLPGWISEEDLARETLHALCRTLARVGALLGV